MENQPKVSLSKQKKVITSLFNILFFDDYKTPIFEKIAGKELGVLSETCKKYETLSSEDSIHLYLDQFHKIMPRAIRHQACLMLMSRPYYPIEISFHLEFNIQEGDFERENFNILESIMLERPSHPIVISFIGDLLSLDEDYQFYRSGHVEREWYNSIISKQIRKYNDSFELF